MRAAQPLVLRKCRALLSLLACLLLALTASAAPGPRILVYTRNQVGKGLYVHDNIAASVAAIRKLGAENGFAADVSDDPALFDDARLKNYKALVFDNTNNEIFDTDAQKAAFQRYIRAGGGFVGIHSASGSMRQWPWFSTMLGGKFKRHARLQPFTVSVIDPQDPSTAHLPATFPWTDEFYYLDNLAPDLHILLAGDPGALDDPAKNDYPGQRFGHHAPLAWRHQFDGGREWFLALGHKPEHYSDPNFTRLILGGILWAMGEARASNPWHPAIPTFLPSPAGP